MTLDDAVDRILDVTQPENVDIIRSRQTTITIRGNAKNIGRAISIREDIRQILKELMRRGN